MNFLGRERNRGVTLLEAVIVLALGAILMYAGMNSIADRNRLVSQGKPKPELIALLNQNLIETRAHPLANLPVVGRCRIRTYDFHGKLIAEEPSSPSNSAACKTAVPSTPKIYKIVLTAKNAKDLDITFDPDEFMKIPTHVADAIRVFEITGGYLSEEKQKYVLSTTIFKN